MADKNRIFVQMASSSYFLGQTSPIEVRDSRLKLVKQLRRGESVEVEDGLYEVSAVLEDGRKQRRMVSVKGGEQKDIMLDSKAKPTQKPLFAPPHTRSGLIVNRAAAMSFELAAPPPATRMAAPKDEESKDKALAVKFVSAKGASVKGDIYPETAYKRIWVFEPTGDIDSVPQADFLIEGKKVTISLPVNPRSTYPLNACRVQKIRNAGALELRAWIAKERTVASTMQNMLAEGYMLEAANIASEAGELLQYKYQDPTGAVLGALLLNKIGQLEQRQGWVQNLARDFDWLNDGKVLLALLLYRDKSNWEEAFSLALKACQKPMMFTESFSLLLDLLRRWPWPETESKRMKALESLSSLSPYTNWDSIIFCYTHPED